MDRQIDQASDPVSLFRTGSAYLLGAAWLGLLFALQEMGSPGPRDPTVNVQLTLLVALATIPFLVLALGFWRNRHYLAGLGWPSRIARALWQMVEWLGWAVAVLALAFLVVPTHANYTVQSKASEMLLALSAARTTVTENAQRNGTLSRSGEGVEPPSGGWIDVAYVGTDGIALAYSAPLGVLVSLRPLVEQGALSGWACEGYPRKAMPASCRDYPLGALQTSLERRLEGTPAEHAQALFAAARRIQAQAPANQVLRPEGALDFGYRDASGMLLLYSDRHGVLLASKPGSSCVVYPASAAFPGCAAGMPRAGR